jgi:hypothetical protein
MTSYIKILQKLDAFCTAHLQIKKFMGEFREQMPNFSTLDERYPVVFATPVSDIEDLNTNQFTLEIYCVDIIQKDRANINTIVSDCHLILKDMFIYYRDDNDLDLDVVGTASISFVNNFDLDYVAGAVMTITFEVAGYGSCEIPMEPITPVTNECEPAILIVKDSDDNILYTLTVDSGDTYTQEISDATAVLKDTSGTVISTTSILAEASEDIEAPDATYTVQYETGTPIESGSIVSGGSVLVEVPDPVVCEDVDLYVGEANVGSFPSGSDIFVKVIQDGLEVIPQDVTVVDDEVSIILDDAQTESCYSSAVNKTGQTSAFTQGKLVNFLTLDGNGSDWYFGHTRRFTGITGGYHNGTGFVDVNGNATNLAGAFPDNIVLDWSQWDKRTGNVFGFRRTYNGSALTHALAESGAAAVSIGTFTTGWRLETRNEIDQLINEGVTTAVFNYQPFNQTADINLWIGTTVGTNTANARALASTGNGNISSVPKTIPFGQYFPCRTFNVSEL